MSKYKKKKGEKGALLESNQGPLMGERLVAVGMIA
jgi:hypothetical protein